mmetsp:Transcript_20401/g.44587  ORF Transcript_20401/g.44587 Transcript_20401/m.44587 type:complete len:90 (-) Transcript_20401:484-753(-)
MTMTSRYNRNAPTTSVLALAAYFQNKLQVVCQTAEFFPAGRRGAAVSTPSSLITIEPFAPGGLRRLCLNVLHVCLGRTHRSRRGTSPVH